MFCLLQTNPASMAADSQQILRSQLQLIFLVCCMYSLPIYLLSSYANTPDDKKNDIIPKWKPSLQPPISWPNLYQIQQARTVSKSARPEDSETALGCQIWPRYWRLKRRLPFRNDVVFFVVGCKYNSIFLLFQFLLFTVFPFFQPHHFL